jgi:hypothetical protein
MSVQTGAGLTIVPTGLHKDQHCAAGQRKDHRDRQTLQQHASTQPLSAAAAKVVGLSGDIGAVAAQIKAVNPTATHAATISTVVSCEPGDLR